MPEFTTRFAPSPTGRLHLGHAFSALSAWRAARARGGRFLLRIEDIDRGRCRPEFEAAIYEDLRWLGVDWEEPVLRQSEHFAAYDSALHRLIDAGLAYRCFKTRKEILDDIARAPHLAPEGPEGPVFTGAALPPDVERAMLAAEAPFAWRLSIAEARARLGERFSALAIREQDLDGNGERVVKATPEIFGDVVIARKDAGTSYHLASVHDDALQGMTHVIRGEDLRAAAHLHRLLQALLEFPAPTYRHHALVRDAAGKRLAKRDAAATLAALRQGGVSPGEVKRRLGFTD